MAEHERVRRLDAPDVCRRIAAAGGPDLEPLRLLGGAVGAYEVRWPDGHVGVLTYAPPPRPGGDRAGRLEATLALADVARAAGQPVPRVEAVVGLPEGDTAVLQERAEGVPLRGAPTRRLVDHLVELTEQRRHLLRGHPLAVPPPSLHLLADGPGYCLRAPLARHDDRTRAILEAVEALGAEPGGDVVAGDDLVHHDFHLENVLVAADDPGRVTAIVDWDGARAGDVALDLAVLLLDLERHAAELAAVVERRIRATTASAVERRVHAHLALRTVDWALRHPDLHDVEWWIASALRRLELTVAQSKRPRNSGDATSASTSDATGRDDQ